MNEEIRKKYVACDSCNSEQEKDGATVYLFKYGEAYHTARCKSVIKYVIEMEKGDALKRGYSQCSKCKGE